MVDYLHMLSIELWREILSLAYPSMPDETTCDDPIDFFDTLPAVVKDNGAPEYFSKHRANLRLVCRFFEPIACDLLFTELEITTKDRGEEKYLEALSSLAKNGRHLGGSRTPHPS
ncbi:hypothetical protein PIIN_04798 [Serendipita indica DSM 11827]|uniref:Uncharacterized protein n=1 Tax=Serendipita indica (strain DSM 11827) TaxID=1109443 RepID=G4THR9_SERID|nr:hypothetical protein PIIN_04798 [Serendipita indica DSM 11827]